MLRERALLSYQEKLSSESRSKSEKKRADNKYALETMMKVRRSVALAPPEPEVMGMFDATAGREGARQNQSDQGT